MNVWKNKKGTANRTCSCGSWKKHWMNFSTEPWPLFCSVEDCLNIATLGGHVINSSSRTEYIIPLCDKCNKRDDVFSIEEDTIFVPANVSETCGR